ncbi:hypothetical protein [Candidatus Tisiphia endosymbiont of Beris chalybata]
MTLLGYPILLSILKKSRTWRYYSDFSHFLKATRAVNLLVDKKFTLTTI